MPVLVHQPSALTASVSNARDVEKNWHDPPAFRKAVGYDVAVIAAAAIAWAVYATIDRGSVLLASSVPTILFLGAIGALVKTYLTWRDGGTWPIWHGAGWFLLTLTLVCLAVPWSSAAFG
jgi:hypothetical protein